MPEEPESAPQKEDSSGNSPAPTSNAPPEPIAAQDPKKLTPEEQMALYEEDLKESDWGHQPC